MNDLQVIYEATPNPHSMKFQATVPIANESLNMTSLQEAGRSPLARKIFSFPWAAGVFVGPSFVTITKQDWVDWEILAEPLSDLIKEHLQSGEGVLLPAPPVASASAGMSTGMNANTEDSNDSPVVRQIKMILENEIRPAVAMDGGDIVFDRYEDGKVYLHMQGACSGCPSSAYTLKEGIETRLREAIPEIQEVIAV